MTFGTKLKSIRLSMGLSQEEFAKKLNTTKQVISRYETEQRTPKITIAQEYANILGVPLQNLIDNNVDFPLATNIIPMPEAKSIPLVGNIACGEPILAEENIEGYVKAPAYCEGSFALRCKGDSMTGARIMDGDIVIIRQQSDIDDGEIAAVLIEDEATLKRVYKMPGRLVLRAENPRYAPIDLSGAELDGVRILGKAVYFISSIK